jgi:glycogen(starch) synthase
VKRFAIISYEYPPDTGKGGIGTYTAQLAACMSKRGYQVHVFAGSPHRSGTESDGAFQIHLVQCNDPFEFRSKVVTSFDEENRICPFDLLESAEINGNAWEIKKQFPAIPLVVRIHAPNSLVEGTKKRYIPFFAKMRYFLGALRRLKWDPGYWRPYNREEDADYHFAKTADAITAPSEAMKEWTVKNWELPGNMIAVLPNLFSPPRQLLDLSPDYGSSSRRIVFFGRLNVLKGLVNGTIAVKKILREFPDWQFRVIGDDQAGPDPGISMRQWMKEHLRDVLDRVEFIDGLPYDQLPAKMADSEIILLPSLFESFSYACCEAMAAGKAIVGSRTGGMAELLDGGESGMLVDPESNTGIRQAIKHLIEHPSLRYDLGVKARRRILEAYDATKTGDELEEFYRKISG